MPVKSILLFTSLFLILNSQNARSHINADDEIQGVQSAHNRAPFLDFDSSKTPFLFETEPESLPVGSLSVRVEEELEKSGMLLTGNLADSRLVDDYLTLNLATKIGFSSQKKAKNGQKLISPYFQTGFWDQLLIN